MEEYQKFNDAINGFSPSFARILLERLKEEEKELMLVVQDVGIDKKIDIEPFLGAILYHLRSQVFGDKTPLPRKKKGREIIELILDTIDVTEEFLNLFEAPKKSKLISMLESGIEKISADDLIKEFSKFAEGGIPKEIIGGFITKLSPCCQAPTEITKGVLHQEICSECKKPINEVLFKISKT